MPYEFLDDEDERYEFVDKPSIPSQLKRQGGLLARSAAEAVGALPLAAMDAGVAVRNFATGDNYKMPSRMYQESLNALLPKPETGIEKITNVAGNVAFGSRFPAPGIKGPAPANYKPPLLAQREAVLREAQQAGYVVPPSSMKNSNQWRMIEGIAGKAKVGQEAAIRNQAVTDKLAAEALGENAAITPGALQAIRAKVYQSGYLPIKQTGTVTPGKMYFDKLDDIIGSSTGASRSFGEAAPSNEAVTQIAKLKDVKQFDAGDAVDMIRILRDQADDFYRAGKNSAGKTTKEAANAIEDALEQHTKDPAILSAFREARKLIAKTHTAQKALAGEGGQSQATSYASQLKSGKPLEGAQRSIGAFAGTFPKYTPNPRGEIFPGASPIDVYGAGGLSALTGSPAPFLYPLARFGLGKYLLSPEVQRGLLTPDMYATPQNIGLLGGAALQSSYMSDRP